MKIEHLGTIVSRVTPVIIHPPCQERNCLRCNRLKTCPSPVSWCALPYYNKTKGCPRFGNDCECPPQAGMFDEVFLVDEVWMVACEFDFAGYLQGMRKLHPDWNDRQLRNVIYWQGQARKVLEQEERLLAFRPELVACRSPEAMGVDLRPTAQKAGVVLEFPPMQSVWRISLLAKRKEDDD